MKILLLTLITTFQVFAGASEKTEEKALTLNEKLVRIHDKLYNLDYRKLSIEDFTVYTESLNEIRDLSKGAHCGASKASEVMVYEDYFVYKTAWSNCSTVNINEDALANIEQNAVRSCYKEGFTSCTIKEKARIKSSESDNPNTSSATCTVHFDAVVLGEK